MNRDTYPGIVLSRGLLASLFVSATLSLTPSAAVACSCAAFPDDEAQAAAIAYARADVVILGVVTAIKTKRWQLPIGIRETTFDVLEAWKGLSGRNPAVVRSAIGSIACGYRFTKPGKYLVFAYWDVERQILTTNMCELTREASEADGLIRELNKIKSAERQTTR